MGWACGAVGGPHATHLRLIAMNRNAAEALVPKRLGQVLTPPLGCAAAGIGDCETPRHCAWGPAGGRPSLEAG
eukprot:1048458-Prymnesium_polylepis.1